MTQHCTTYLYFKRMSITNHIKYLLQHIINARKKEAIKKRSRFFLEKYRQKN